MMKTYHFKTNIQCDGCIAKVTPFLNQIKELDSWHVDTRNPAKILTATGAAPNLDRLIMERIKEAGYRIEPVSE